MGRGPICIATNRPLLPTPGPTGVNDASDPGCKVQPVRSRGILGGWGPTDWIAVQMFVLPGGAALGLVIGWVSRNVDEKDMAAVRRIVGYVLDHPDAAFTNLKALGVAAYTEADSGISGRDLEQLGLRASAAGNPLLMGVTSAGMVWGFLKSIYEGIEQVIDVVTDLEKFIDESLQLLEAILSPGGEEACAEIGRQVGGSAATRVREIANENYLFAAFHLGEIVGPFVVGLVLAYFTAGGGAALMAGPRVAQVLAKLRKIPKAEKVLQALSKHMRRKRRPHPLRDVTDAELDEAIEAMTSPAVKGGKKKRIGDKSVPKSRPPRLDGDDIPRNPGESFGDAIRRVKSIIGRKVSDHPNVRGAWDRAARHVLKNKRLTQQNARELYDSAREQFWREIRDDPVAKRHFENAGFEFPASRDTAPMLKGVRAAVPDTEVRISLDHFQEIRANWTRALDADNLKLEFQMPNSFREIVQARHPELR